MARRINTATVKPALQRLFDALLELCGLDFGQYKLATVMRRIERRMQVMGCVSLHDYADRVEASQDECEALRRELLIPVTGFFRDPGAFDALGTALQALILSLPPGRPLRLWSAGCATGEEAYSLAIAALEACAAVQTWPGLKVFATDVDPRFLAIGNSGSYPAGAADTLTPERLSQWFTLQDEHWVVKPELRQMVLFTRHNLLDDAPFTRIDLVVCRNTLIYFQAETQDRVMRRLQYALNPQGVLFLGSSESLGGLQADFQALNAGHKLYRLVRPVLTALAVREGFGRSSLAMRGRSPPPPPPSSNEQMVDAALAQLVQAYAPLSLLVGPQRQLIHAWGPTQRFLRVPEGAARLDAIRLLPERLAAVAGHALLCAQRERKDHHAPPLWLAMDGQDCCVRVVARPLPGPELPEPWVMLSIEELNQATAGREAPLTDAEVDRLASVEQELLDTRASLHTSIADLESANEELQATNEELMSSNEELQSTNEELQSVNEELYTVNAEYNAKLDTVSALNADLDGMSQATGIATLFVDQHLRLLRFTPEAAALFQLRAGDMGRPVDNFKHPLSYPELLADLRTVLDGGPPVEREVTGAAGGLYLARVVGYGERPGAARRAVISLIDVSRLRDMQRLQSVIDSLPEHVAVLDANGNIRQVNHAWTRYACANGAADDARVGVGSNYLSVLAHASSPEALDVLRGLQQVLSGRLEHYRVTYPCHSPAEQHWFVMHAAALRGEERGAVVAHFDITPWHDTLTQAGEAGHV